MHLVPKVPKKKRGQFLPKDVGDIPEARLVLRFSAVFAQPSTIDAERGFVISYYLVDDTISIFEKTNSGFSSGKFLERGPQTWPDRKPILATDLYVGAEVNIRNFQFRIVGCAKRTK